jgi:uncharacterized SAM-dependent methyltransferase
VRYIGLDISQPLLDLTGQNMFEWFGDQVQYEGYCLDFCREPFGKYLVRPDTDYGRNLVLLFGGTLTNFRDPDQVLRHIGNNVGPQDILAIGAKLDTEKARQELAFGTTDIQEPLPEINRRTMDILGFDHDRYTPEKGFDPVERARYIRALLNEDVELHLDPHNDAGTVQLSAGERILLWRTWHHTQEEFETRLRRTGFSIINSYFSGDKAFSLNIARIEEAA